MEKRGTCECGGRMIPERFRKSCRKYEVFGRFFVQHRRKAVAGVFGEWVVVGWWRVVGGRGISCPGGWGGFGGCRVMGGRSVLQCGWGEGEPIVAQHFPVHTPAGYSAYETEQWGEVSDPAQGRLLPLDRPVARAPSNAAEGREHLSGLLLSWDAAIDSAPHPTQNGYCRRVHQFKVMMSPRQHDSQRQRLSTILHQFLAYFALTS